MSTQAKTPNINGAFGANPNQLKVIQTIYETVLVLQGNVNPPSGVPPAMQWSVGGQDGDFVITVTLPQNNQYSSIALKQLASGAKVTNSQGTVITHQIQSSTDTLFDAAGDTITYGPDTKTVWWITDTPNSNRYFRLRSSYDGGKTWNPWVVYEDPQVCGVVPIWSGQVRAIRQFSNAQLNTTNYATVDSIAAGATCSLRVYGTAPGVGWTRQVADDTTEGPFPAATLTGYAYNTAYNVYWDSQYSIYRVFLSSNFPPQLPNRYRWVGQVTTLASSSVVLPTAHAVLSGGSVIAIVIDTPGSGMSSAPTVTITPQVGDPGTGATATDAITSGALSSVTVTQGGVNYVAVPAVNFSGGTSGNPGGGGPGGGPRGCVEEGTPVTYPPGTVEVREELVDCSEWIAFGGPGLPIVHCHPDTLVAVWKRAKDLDHGDLLDIGDDGLIAKLTIKGHMIRASKKVSRIVNPFHWYRAYGRYKLHNMKIFTS